MKKIIYIFSLLFLYCSCNKNEKIESIHIVYYNYYIASTMTPIMCDDIKIKIPSFKRVDVYDSMDTALILESYIDYAGVLDTTLTNSILLNKISEELLYLNKGKTKDIDARISVKIKYKNGKEDILCIGGSEANTISLNGISQGTNNRLLYLIKNNIGYYPWFSKEVLDNMDELKDSSFIKEPFVKSSYYKKYLQLENKINIF